MGDPDFVSIITAAYAIDQSPSAWLDGVLRAARPMLDRGSGVVGYFVDCSEGGFHTWDHQAIDFFTDEDALFRHYEATVPLEARRAVHTFAPAGWGNALPDTAQTAQEWGASVSGIGIGVNALDASLRGVTLTAFDRRPDLVPPSDEELARWARVAAHIAAGSRFARRGLDLEAPEAVLSPSGRVLHAQGRARSKLALEVLRDAVLRADRARTRRERKRDQDGAIESWKALVGGRWSVVDSFDRDGRRFVLARPNEPEPERQAVVLTHRERQVVCAAGLGHSNKLIAYELGLHTSTVSTLLNRARTKLRLASRMALVRWARRNAIDPPSGT